MTLEQNRLCQALTKHFGVRKIDLMEEVKEQEKENPIPVVHFDLGDYGRIDIGTTKSSLPLGKLIVFKHFKKSPLYAESMDLIHNHDAEFVAFYTGGCLLALSEDTSYNGVGGIFVKGDEEKAGFCIEPVQNYLSRHYPIYREV